MRVILVIVFILFSNAVFAGDKDTLVDVYKGTLPAKGSKGIVTELSLYHEPYADAGIFTLVEKYIEYPKANVTRGEWTVLRGDATDRNAIVIELYDELSRQSIRHYLRLKDGTIKVLDGKLRAMKGKGNYILKKKQY